MRYRAIQDHACRFSVRLMCRALEVSPAGYYAWATRPESRRARANRALLGEIRALHAESRRTYGSPSICDVLRKRGRRVGENRVARLMRAHGIRAKTVKKWKATTDSSHKLPVAPTTAGTEPPHPCLNEPLDSRAIQPTTRCGRTCLRAARKQEGIPPVCTRVVGKQSVWTDLKGQVILGEEDFVARHADHLKKTPRHPRDSQEPAVCQ